MEETEIEDLVAELLKAVQAPDEYERCLRLLVHDLGELGFMIEHHCADVGLLEPLRRVGATTTPRPCARKPPEAADPLLFVCPSPRLGEGKRRGDCSFQQSP